MVAVGQDQKVQMESAVAESPADFPMDDSMLILDDDDDLMETTSPQEFPSLASAQELQESNDTSTATGNERHGKLNGTCVATSEARHAVPGQEGERGDETSDEENTYFTLLHDLTRSNHLALAQTRERKRIEMENARPRWMRPEDYDLWLKAQEVRRTKRRVALGVPRAIWNHKNLQGQGRGECCCKKNIFVAYDGDQGSVDDEGTRFVWVTWDTDKSREPRPTLPDQVVTIQEPSDLDDGTFSAHLLCACEGEIPPTQKRVLPGFEIWIGGMNDAMNIEQLRKRKFGAILNMAMGDFLDEKEAKFPTTPFPAGFAPEVLIGFWSRTNSKTHLVNADMVFIPYDGYRRVPGRIAIVKRRENSWAIGSYVLNIDLSTPLELVWDSTNGGDQVGWSRMQDPAHMDFNLHETERRERNKIWGQVEFSEAWYANALGYPDEILQTGPARKTFRFLSIFAKDEFGYPLDSHFQEVEDFLALCAEEQRIVLVHCVMGRNRSVSAAIAFLVRQRIFNLYDAVDLVSQRRERVIHNDHFMKILVKDSLRLGIPIRE